MSGGDMTPDAPDQPDEPDDRPVHRAPKRRKGSTAVLAMVAAAVVVVVVAAIVLIANDDDEDSASDSGGDATAGSPADVVEQYFAAAEEADCETIVALVSDITWEEEGLDRDEALANCTDAAETGQQLEGMTLDEVGEVTEDGDVAVVEVDGTLEGEPLTETFRLVREDGDWKIDLTE